LLAVITGEIKLPLGFSYELLFSNRFDRGRDFLYDPKNTQIAEKTGGYGYRQHSITHEWSIDNILRWTRVVADIHSFNFTFLYNAEKIQTYWDIQRNSSFEVSEQLGYHGVHAGESPVLLNNDGVATGTAIMGRLNYTINGRYMVTATMRRDGYSAFGQENPYGYFPSMALGWALSEEDFFNIDNISLLRFRLSWGRNGNRAVDRYAALSRLEVERYSYGDDPGRAVSGFYSATMANSGLKWETTSAYNIGVDFGLFNNRLHGNLEVYRNKTYDLLVDRKLPAIIGYTEVAANLGELQNQGLEFTLNSNNINRRNIEWRSNFVFSLNRNKILSLYGDMVDITDEEGNVIGQREVDDPTNQWFIGESIHRNWNYEVLGIYYPEDADAAAVYGRKPGDFILRDVNGDGTYSALEDKIFQGYSTPRFRLGLNNHLTLFDNFEVTAFIRADLGHESNNVLHTYYASAAYYVNYNHYNTPYSTTTNVVDGYSRLDSSPSPSHAYYESRSFVRLQDISIGYNLPNSVLETIRIQQARVYVSSRNLLTFTNWTHNDPESGSGLMPRYFNLGLDLTF
jgi:TonB-linked SusC/RagA family outer membrane protein